MCTKNPTLINFYYVTLNIFIVEKLDNTNKPEVNCEEKMSMTYLPEITF